MAKCKAFSELLETTNLPFHQLVLMVGWGQITAEE